jgi:uncharacterized protein YdaL
MHPFAIDSLPRGRARGTAVAAGLVLVTGGFLGACRGPEPTSHSTSQLAASTMVHNLAPGEGPPAPMTEGALQPLSGEAVDQLQSALSSGVGGALVLYDTTGPYGALGELYGIGAANLVSHFGSWTAKSAVSYTCGQLASFSALIYLGSTYDEPLPTCLLDDVLATTKPVVWSFFNLWQLTARATPAAFTAKYGFSWVGLDYASVAAVRYKGRSLVRYAANGAGILNTTVANPAIAKVLAEAVRADGTTFPWAVRGANFTYVGEIPFAYMSEEDRYLIYGDLMFDALAPATVERHRALVRLEDISADTDVVALRTLADYLYAQGIPYGFGVVPDFRDPKGYYNNGVAQRIRLQDNRAMSTLLKTMTTRGGTMVMHGNTHQWDTAINPYTQVSADDYEFYRVSENTDHTLTYQGPIPGDSLTWARGRLSAADLLFRNAALPLPTIFEFPHYSASATDYLAAATRFTTRWERSLYYNGLLSGTAINYSRIFGQLFPYVVRDVYGSKVIPENLGNIEPTMFYQYPTRLPSDIIRAAEKNLVVRDGVASFYFHPIFDLALLRQTIDGIRALGYTFVSPATM